MFGSVVVFSDCRGVFSDLEAVCSDLQGVFSDHSFVRSYQDCAVLRQVVECVDASAAV